MFSEVVQCFHFSFIVKHNENITIYHGHLIYEEKNIQKFQHCKWYRIDAPSIFLGETPVFFLFFFNNYRDFVELPVIRRFTHGDFLYD